MAIHKQRWFPPPDYVEQIYGYGRVSHASQVDGESMSDQDARIRAYVTMMKLEEGGPFENAEWCRMLLEPNAQSAFMKPLKMRPAGSELYESLKPGDHVVIDKIDRMFRNPADFYEMDRHFTENGISLHVVNLGGNAINTTNHYGRFMLGLFVGVAEMESAIKGERIADARARRRAGGTDAGVPVPYFIALEGLPPGKLRGCGAKRVLQPWAKAGLEKIKYLYDVEKIGFWQISRLMQKDEGFKGKGPNHIEHAYWFWSAWLDANCPDLNELKFTEFTKRYKEKHKNGSQP